jgi:hypothetical protein
LAPDYFQSPDLDDMTIDGSYEYSAVSRDDALSKYDFLKTCTLSKKRKRKFVYGALYERIRIDSVYIISRSNGCNRYRLEISLPENTTTFVEIASASSERGMLAAIGNLASKLPDNGNARKNTGDLGEMFAIGVRSQRRKLVYAPTKLEGVLQAMASLTKFTNDYFRENFRETYDDIRSAEHCKSGWFLDEMGGCNGMGGSIMMSCNLGNSAHIDIRDNSRGVCVWIEDDPGLASNWYFVLPDVSIGGNLGVCIELFHGAVISWDGRLVRHCTSVTAAGPNNNVWACMFVSSRD